MLKINDKIQMVKAIGGLDRIGDEFTVVNISDKGDIEFKSTYGVGSMTKEEFNEHFIEVSKWIDSSMDYKYKTDYETYVKVKQDDIKAKKIFVLYDEEFDLQCGIDFCLAKIAIKRIK